MSTWLLVVTILFGVAGGEQKEVNLTIEQPSLIACEVELEKMPATALSLAQVGLLSISAECILVHPDDPDGLFRHLPAPGQ